ncbi:MAG: hypothetical protein FIA95_15845 [Gemmatimonadetes bacterium]|nr:hypothetical protein [Gemmatimonadota bacterium]
MNGSLRARGSLAVLTLGSLVLLAACDGGTGPADPDVTADEAEAIAGYMFDLDALAVGVVNLASTTGKRTFSKTTACPAGGSVSVSASSESSTNQETKVVSNTWSTTQTHAACTISKTRADKTWTAVMDGGVPTSGTSSYKLPETKGAQRPLLSWASTPTGSIPTKIGDKSQTCVMDVQQAWDPVKQVFTITGTMCGRSVDTTKGGR